MKKKVIIFVLLNLNAFSVNAKLIADDCIDMYQGVGIRVTDSMIEDFGLRKSDIVLDKTKMTLLAQESVTEQMGLFFALQDKKNPVYAPLKPKQLLEIYTEDNAENLIIKFDYVNRAGKHNVLLSSHLISEKECTIRYNGYIIVKREF